MATRGLLQDAGDVLQQGWARVHTSARIRNFWSEYPDVTFPALWQCTSAQPQGCALHPFWGKLNSQPRSGFGNWAQTRSGCVGSHCSSSRTSPVTHTHLAGECCLGRLLLLGHTICCGPRQPREIGGAWQGSKFLWILVVRRELLGKSHPSWSRRMLRSVCSYVVSDPSPWSSGFPWASQLPTDPSKIAMDQGNVFKEWESKTMLHTVKI